MESALYLAARSADHPIRSRLWQGGFACLVLAGTIAIAANADSFGVNPLDMMPIDQDAAAPARPGRLASLFDLSAPKPDHGTDVASGQSAAGDLVAGASAAASHVELRAMQHALLIEGWPGEAGGAAEAASDPVDNDDLDLTDPPRGRTSGETTADWGPAAWNRGGAGGAFAGSAELGASPGGGRSAHRGEPVATLDQDSQVILLLDAPVATGPIPEPATWATMLLGLGLAGAMVRRRRWT